MDKGTELFAEYVMLPAFKWTLKMALVKLAAPVAGGLMVLGACLVILGSMKGFRLVGTGFVSYILAQILIQAL